MVCGGARILLVDDVAAIRRAIRRELGASYGVLEANAVESALTLLRSEEKIAAVISDHNMGPNQNGLDLLLEVRSQWPKIVRIMCSGKFEPTALDVSLQKGPVQYFVPKPWAAGEVRAVLSSSLEVSQSSPPPPPRRET